MLVSWRSFAATVAAGRTKYAEIPRDAAAPDTTEGGSAGEVPADAGIADAGVAGDTVVGAAVVGAAVVGAAAHDAAPPPATSRAAITAPARRTALAPRSTP